MLFAAVRFFDAGAAGGILIRRGVSFGNAFATSCSTATNGSKL
jgi:hypothetical protein